MLLLTVTSLAISCFSVKASVFKTQSGSKTALNKSTPKTINKPKNSAAEETLKLRKQAVLDASRNQGAIAATVALTTARCTSAYLQNAESSGLLHLAVTVAIAATLNFAQDYYFVSDKDKATTTSFERVKKMVIGTTVPFVVNAGMVSIPKKIDDHYKPQPLRQ